MAGSLRDVCGPDGSLGGGCERYVVSGAQLFSWRGQAVFGELTSVVPPALPAFAVVEIAEADLFSPPTSFRTKRINVELPSGVRLAVDAGDDPQASVGVLAVLTQ